jgi:hypothetical protein
VSLAELTEHSIKESKAMAIIKFSDGVKFDTSGS